ncbi:MAG: hypothetical protein JOY91_16365 [Sinobacteraceae bacterium]|nr:hypothetical protein [Nevskiaceae bacterium]
MLQGRLARLDTTPALVRHATWVVYEVEQGRMGVDIGRLALYGVNTLRQLLADGSAQQRLVALEERMRLWEAKQRERPERRQWLA